MTIDESQYAHIKGWGIDADPENEPTYPMKHYTGDDHQRIHWERPSLQPVKVEVLHSNERPNVSAVFGSALPPSGLSGVIRRAAFTFSESEYGHWLSLLLADRVQVVEGVLSDLVKGHVPNLPAEHGWKAEWQHNRKRLVTRLAVKAVVIGTIAALVFRKKQPKGLVNKLKDLKS